VYFYRANAYPFCGNIYCLTSHHWKFIIGHSSFLLSLPIPAVHYPIFFSCEYRDTNRKLSEILMQCFGMFMPGLTNFYPDNCNIQILEDWGARAPSPVNESLIFFVLVFVFVHENNTASVEVNLRTLVVYVTPLVLNLLRFYILSTMSYGPYSNPPAASMRWWVTHRLKNTYIRLIITYDKPHSGTMIYAVTLRNSSVSRHRKITCKWWN